MIFLMGLFILFVLTIFLVIGFKITGALLAIVFWFAIKLPLAILMWVFGILCCCTILLIPVGVGCFKSGLRLMVPGPVV